MVAPCDLGALSDGSDWDDLEDSSQQIPAPAGPSLKQKLLALMSAQQVVVTILVATSTHEDAISGLVAP